MGIWFKNARWPVLLFHIAFGITLFTIGNQNSCLGPTLIIYAIIFAFSFFTIKNLKADPIQVSEQFLGNYAYIILAPFLFYIIFSLLQGLESSAILSLLATSTGYINIAVLMFICPLSAGPAIYQLISSRYQ